MIRGPEEGGTERICMPNEIMRVIQCMLAMQRYPWEQGVCAQDLLEAGREEFWIPMAYDAIRRPW